jgi:hypothetical protein
MATKLGRKETPSGVDPASLKYQGRPSKEQDDFGPEVGIADMVCVNQFGDANNNKYYHAGVVKSASRWYVYLEWGRVTGGKSWDGGFNGQDFQFVECTGEEDARDFFQKQCRDKNVKRLEKKKIGSTDVWVGKAGKDGYVVQRLATRERGLPDAYLIKDDEGLQKKPVASVESTKAKKAKAPRTAQAHPQVVGLARSLVGGTMDYARSAQKSTGIVPTMAAIVEVRDRLIPDALQLLARIGPDEAAQLKNSQLQQLSTYVATIVPRPIPRTGDPTKVILSQSNIFSIQQDLDAFEAALKNEDFEVDAQADTDLDPTAVLGRELSWIDPTSERGRWVLDAYAKMTNNRHGGVGNVRVLNVFEVSKPELRKSFVERTTAIAKMRAGESHNRAGLQPKRPDLAEIGDIYADANVCLGIHGTRAVNVQPIMSSNLRLPKSLKGVQITGAAFGHGIYFATDWKKSYGYTGHGGSYWVKGGTIKGRGFFMFLCDLTLGKPLMARTTMWDQVDCPRGHDSIFAERGRTSVENDEHVIFDPHQQNIRYLIEGDIR